jgi:hypothetical protein
MDFLFYKPLSSHAVSIDHAVVDLCADQIIIKSHGILLAHRPSTSHCLDEIGNSGCVLSGRISYGEAGKRESLLKLRDDLLSGIWPLPDEYDGMFSGVVFDREKVCIFNDPIGLFHLYYCLHADYVAVATNLNALYKLGNDEINLSCLVLEATKNEFVQYGSRTVLKHVHTLFPGELIVRMADGRKCHKYDTTIKQADQVAPEGFAEELVEYINNQCKSHYSCIDKLVISLSGGIDSRVNLAVMLNQGKNLRLVNYGKAGTIDSSIPQSIANMYDLPLDIVDAQSLQFPEKSVVERIVKETDSLYINSWISVLGQSRDRGEYPAFLLGDMCDILRSKGIGRIKTRKYRRHLYLRKFLFNKELTLSEITDRGKAAFRNRVVSDVVAHAEKAIAFCRLPVPAVRTILEDIRNDMDELFRHLDRYQPATLESYEELFGIFTHGRKSMGKQLNLLKMRFSPEIPLLNLRIIRKVLNYSPKSRYGDELTNRMFKHPSWEVIGRFPTAQNPFCAYNSSLFTMLFGWFVRSSIDQLLLKIYVATKGKFGRQRVFRSVDWQATYSCPGSLENYKSYYSANVLAADLIATFEKRMEKEAWPLSGMDLMPYAQANYYLDHFVRKDV